jgi:hypothetical protein
VNAATPADVRRRDYRDEVIEAFADAEAALRARARLERAILLDLVNAQRVEIGTLKRDRDALREELRRVAAAAVRVAA